MTFVPQGDFLAELTPAFLLAFVIMGISQDGNAAGNSLSVLMIGAALAGGG